MSTIGDNTERQLERIRSVNVFVGRKNRGVKLLADVKVHKRYMGRRPAAD
jgi:hypothetical protein